MKYEEWWVSLVLCHASKPGKYVDHWRASSKWNAHDILRLKLSAEPFFGLGWMSHVIHAVGSNQTLSCMLPWSIVKERRLLKIDLQVQATENTKSKCQHNPYNRVQDAIKTQVYRIQFYNAGKFVRPDLLQDPVKAFVLGCYLQSKTGSFELSYCTHL